MLIACLRSLQQKSSLICYFFDFYVIFDRCIIGSCRVSGVLVQKVVM